MTIDYELENQRMRVLFPRRNADFSFLRSFKTDTQSQRQFELEFFRGEKTAGALTLPFLLDVVPK